MSRRSKQTTKDKVVHLNAFKDVDSASDQAIEWLARLRADDLPERELGAFAEWLAASSEHKAAFDEACDLWELSAQALEEMPVIAEPQVLKAKPYSALQPFSVAASFLVVCALLLLQLQAPVFSTSKGEHRRVVLEDGSIAFLNTNTAIEVHYEANERRIELQRGEAWFDVKTDATRPFRVIGDFATATALGTAFTVRDTDSFTRVTVTEGRVQVDADPTITLNSTDQTRFELKPEDSLLMNAIEAQLSSVNLDVAQAWKSGQLIYKDVTLETLVADLNRYMPVTLSINDSDLAASKLSAVIEVDDHQAMLDALSQVLPVKYKAVSDNLVILTKAR